ncbi:MAG: deoxyguanosinetriphosphate triphosphohydrolase [Clostridium sp.]|nr:deoxyguanosinetriphosphate triphosphohydrolase [Clostridium sp.]
MDWERLLSSQTQVPRDEEPEEFKRYSISDLEKDYKAIVSSSAFRRLQDKTQVFPLDKSDFVRTRLTHSMEVSTIARQLGIMITSDATQYLPAAFQKNKNAEREKIPSILSCAGLLHDIGNPPFGHFGEVVIGEWFKNEFEKETFTYKGQRIKELLTPQMREDLCHFEGNAQALRILSKISNKKTGHEINLTKGVISSLIKYPVDSLHYTNSSDQDIRKHKLGYFYAETKSFNDIARETGTLLSNGEVARHPLAYLMEAADDIAYSTADLEDAYQKGLFTLTEFIAFFEKTLKTKHEQTYVDKVIVLIDDLKNRIKQIEAQNPKCTKEDYMIAFQNWMDFARQWFMYCVAFSFSKNYSEIMHGTYNQELIAETFHGASIEILKDAMREFVYINPEIVKLELSAQKILSSLLNDFIYAILYYDEKDYKLSQKDKKLCGLIPENLRNDYVNAKKNNNDAYNLYLRFLMITDFLSGMTDSYAKNLYQELNGIY